MNAKTPLAETGLLAANALEAVRALGITTVVQLVQRMLDDFDRITKAAGLTEQEGVQLLDTIMEKLPEGARTIAFSGDPDVALLPSTAQLDLRLERGQALRRWASEDMRIVVWATRIHNIDVDTTVPPRYLGQDLGRPVYRIQVRVADADMLRRLRTATNIRWVGVDAPTAPSRGVA